MSDIKSRKADHIALCETDDVAFQRKSNLLEQVDLVHDALPDLALDEIDLSTTFAGKRLAAPLIIAAMTGGVERAEAINRDLAAVAESYGIGFGFGSQRPLLERGIRLGYRVRDLAPSALVLGNIGIVQARGASTERLAALVETCGADALCVHLNPAMEVIQPEGDRDFRGGLETIARLVEALPVPVVVKETGCGLSRSVGRRVADLGVAWVDTSGAGGTSWVGVETLRASSEDDARLGRRYWDWGIPTAASVAQLDGLGLGICATGGISSGLDAARAIALGAACAGVARPFLQAWSRGGRDAVHAEVGRFIQEIRLAMLLTGSADVAALQRAPLVLGPALRRWVPRDASLRERVVGGVPVGG
jgi:isopentenyl-diphosphate delta-isomerase